MFDRRLKRRDFLRGGLVLGAGAVSMGALAACGMPGAASPAASGGGSKLEIYSWWTSPGEVEALDAL